MLIKKGAEASLFLEDWQGRKVIMKRRLPKKYRLPEIDEKIRTYRTIHESQLLHYAKEAGVPTPTIFMVGLADSNIIMEFVEGKQVKQVLDGLSFEERKGLSKHIGVLIGRLHCKGIIHGDLTTSNMILTLSGKVVFVDFGLGEKTVELELKGVDLHLMKRAFQSTHFRYAKECFNAVLEGYTKIVGDKVAKKVLRKIREIEKRGRYISERRKTEE
ncbi:MAG: Kae1-associated kinase Bud32 [Candidatus Bathyarchaeota archaeon]|nr:Kae1-associated kinase Bud32 [Candidatus Bathyarchaeota archaeon]MDH5494244.1 Kae1-associated kinase Bud32 [Candidatus Bathyarchaeota archaeon]